MAVLETQKEYEKVPTKELINDYETQKVPSTYGYGIRHLQSLLLFVCMAVGYIARAHLGVTVVAMTNSLDVTNNSIITNETEFVSNGTYVINATHGIELRKHDNSTVVANEELDMSMWNVYRKYDWSKSTQEIILDAFFLGYALMMFPTGMICQRFGGKLPLQICLLINGITSLLTPTVAVWLAYAIFCVEIDAVETSKRRLIYYNFPLENPQGGWQAVCCCRVLQGLSQSGLYPSAHTLLSKWVPISERASLASYVYTGTLLGTVLAFQISGLMADSPVGWPGAFWFTGVVCIGTFALLTIFGAATPSDHKSISEEEKNFIMGRIDDGKKKVAKVPWKLVFKSKHVWATMATHMAAGTCFVFLFTQIPTYMHYILGFDVKNSGLLSSLPYVASAFTTMGYGILSDYCTNRGYFKLKTARILCNTLAQWGPAICLASVSFIDNEAIAVVFLVLALGLFAGIHSGWMVNYIDLAPNFGGSLMATGNTFATLGVLTQPFLVSNILKEVTNRDQWRILMISMAALIFVCNAFFIFFMSADTQPWNELEEQENEETEMNEKGLKLKK